MTDDDDYSRVEDYLDDEDNDIYMRYGDSYFNLEASKKEDVLLEKFFKGKPAYQQSAYELRLGLDEYHNGNLGNNMEVVHFTRKGKSMHMVRDTTTGRFLRGIK